MSLASHSAGRKNRKKRVRQPFDYDDVGIGDGTCKGGGEVEVVEEVEVDRKLIDEAEWMRVNVDDSDRQRWCIRTDY